MNNTSSIVDKLGIFGSRVQSQNLNSSIVNMMDPNIDSVHFMAWRYGIAFNSASRKYCRLSKDNLMDLFRKREPKQNDICGGLIGRVKRETIEKELQRRYSGGIVGKHPHCHRIEIEYGVFADCMFAKSCPECEKFTDEEILSLHSIEDLQHQLDARFIKTYFTSRKGFLVDVLSTH